MTNTIDLLIKAMDNRAMELTFQAARLAALSIGDYAPIRAAYESDVRGQIYEYLHTPGARITKYKNMFKRSMTDAFYDAFSQGIADGGGDYVNDPDPSDVEWFVAKQNAERGYIDQLFQQLKDLKEEAKTDPTAIEGEPERRAEGYAKTLDGIYNMGKVRGKKNVMLTFGGTDGQESCKTCQKYKNKRHSAKWWLARNLIVFRGNTTFECGCYQCQHYHFDDKGNLYTF